MPLTISHPAAAVPFARFGLVLSALIIGSMTPDFPFFIPIFAQGGFSHSVIGLFFYCVPVGLVSLVIFHFLIKYPAFSLLPIGHQQRLYKITRDFSFWPLRRFLLIILSILVGAFTHILWDSFTHAQGWMVQHFILLQSPIFSFQSMPFYDFLQYGSTLLGGVLLSYWYIKWYKNAKSFSVPQYLTSATSTKVIVLTLIGFVAFVTAIFSGFTSLAELQNSFYRRLLNGHLFIVSVSTLMVVLVAFSVCWHFFLKRKTRYHHKG